MDEQWSWKRAVSVSPNRVGKDHVLMFRMILWLVIWSIAIYGAIALFQKFQHKPTPDITTVAEGGTANVDKSSTNVVHNHFPLTDIFSFGSKSKIND